MALQFKVGPSYEEGSLYVIDTMPITVSTGAGEADTDFTYIDVVRYDNITVDGKVYRSHSFILDGAKATEIFLSANSTRPIYNFGGLWDFDSSLYDETSPQITDRVVYDPDDAVPLTTQEEYEALFPDDWDDTYLWKYFVESQIAGASPSVYVNFYNRGTEERNPKTSFGPNDIFALKIYELKRNYPMNMRCWIDDKKFFGFSQFWTIERDSIEHPDLFRVKSHQRFFGNTARSADAGFLEEYRAGIKVDDNPGNNSYFMGYPSEYTSEGYIVGDFPTKPMSELNNEPIHSVACILEYEFEGEKYYGFCTMSFGYDSTRPEGNKEFVYQSRVFGISENFFEGAIPEPTPEEGDGEEPGGNGVRPPLVNQGVNGPMGLDFDLGLSRVNPATRGIKLTYMPLSTLNQYIDEYVESKTGDLPSGSLTDDLKLLIAPATEAIMQNCYDTILDVYKLPITPRNMTSYTSFNIGGEVISISGARVFSGFAQKQTIELGIVRLPEIFGSYLDYAPNINAQIWLPFCGMYQIPINAFMGGQLRLQYIIDLLSGSCTAYLFGTDRFGHQTLIGSFGGDMKLPVPLGITAANTGIIGQALRSGMNTFANSSTKPFLTTRLAQENVGRGLEAYNFMQSKPDMPNAVGTALQTGFGGLAQIETGLKQTGKNIVGGIAKGAEFISQYREAMPELSGVIGQVGGVSGWCSWMQPYIRLTTPVRKNPEGYTYYLGKPANTKKTISSLGDGTFNRANAPRLNIPGALPQELDEIYNILTTGFYK